MSDPTPPGPRWKWFAYTFAALGGVSSIAELLGAVMEGFKVIPWSIGLALFGTAAAIGAEKLWTKGIIRRPRALAVLFVAAILVSGCLGFVIARLLSGSACDGRVPCPPEPTLTPTVSVSPPPTYTATPTISTPPPTPSPPPGCASTEPDAGAVTHAGRPNHAARRDGVTVYCNAMAAAGPRGVPKVPFWKEVTVECWTEDLSGIESITRMYRLRTDPWTGLYAASDVFSNGDPPEGGTTNFDDQLEHC